MALSPAQPRHDLLRWVLAFWLVVAAFFVFLAGSARFVDVFPADERIAHTIQTIDVPGLGGFFDVVNALGYSWCYLPITLGAAFGFAVARCWWEAVLLPLTIVPRSVNSALQDLIDRPRPSSDIVKVIDHVSGPGFPSGHTVGTTILFGLLFFLVPAAVSWRPLRWALQAACLLAVVSAGPARVYVGAHWPSDALGAYLLAFLFLVPLTGAYLVAQRRRRQIRPGPISDSSPGRGMLD
jgi:undecaprenyl-diphosphatase